jgi:circadian clock protein KaiC
MSVAARALKAWMKFSMVAYRCIICISSKAILESGRRTTLGLQFLLDGARRREVGLYITLSETKEELQVIAQSHGWELDLVELFELSSMQRGDDTENTFFHPSEVELNLTTKAMLDEVERVNPSRVVFDSLSEMRMLAQTPLRYRHQILQLKQFLVGRKCTALFLDDCTSASKDLQNCKSRSWSHRSS